MNRRTMLVVVALSFIPTGRVTAQNADIEGVKAVSRPSTRLCRVLDDVERSWRASGQTNLT